MPKALQVLKHLVLFDNRPVTALTTCLLTKRGTLSRDVGGEKGGFATSLPPTPARPGWWDSVPEIAFHCGITKTGLDVSTVTGFQAIRFSPTLCNN